jgi:predicted class III extradiol MEMO1 family dioxygenase
VKEYYALVKTILDQNTQTRDAPQNTRFDLIEFPDLSPDEVNAYQERISHSSCGSVPTTLTVQAAEESAHNLSFMGEAAPSDESDGVGDDESDVP